MFLAHSFRLRDPWQCEPTEVGVRWSRLFHRPTGLEPDDELWLVISGLPAGSSVQVNGATLSPDPSRCDVTAALRDANQVEIFVPAKPGDSPAAPAKFPYDARLGVVAHS